LPTAENSHQGTPVQGTKEKNDKDLNAECRMQNDE
jgi:hypothetical protein